MIAALTALILIAQTLPTPVPRPLQQNQAPVQANPAPAAIPEVAGIDRLFATAATQGNNAEIAMARLAVARASAPEVQGYAQKMIGEHLGLAAAFRPALERLRSSPPAQPLAPADQMALEHLRTLPNVDFDQTYLMQQVGDHLATLTVFQTEADNGTQPALRALAREWLPTIEAHLELALSLTRHIGGSSPFK